MPVLGMPSFLHSTICGTRAAEGIQYAFRAPKAEPLNVFAHEVRWKREDETIPLVDRAVRTQ